MLGVARHRATSLIALSFWLLALGAVSIHCHEVHGAACQDQTPCSLCLVGHHTPVQVQTPTSVSILPERATLALIWTPPAPRATRCERRNARAPPPLS